MDGVGGTQPAEISGHLASLGYEVALTVVKAGANLQKEYHPGDRFIIQADIFYKGIGTAYGYELRGGFQQYNIIDERVLKGDGGNYLLPVNSPYL